MTINIVSFSGGRTSAYLVHQLDQLRKTAQMDVRYVFMETGAEHPKTYEFIRNVVKHWGINITCLRIVVNPELGKANSYEIIDIDEIGFNLKPWRDICAKYGTPYVRGAFCTRTMKIEVFERYCCDYFPNAVSWLGIRADEQGRVWGESAHRMLRKMAYESHEMQYLLSALRKENSEESIKSALVYEHAFLDGQYEPIINRMLALRASRQRFLSEISNYTKQDVLNWWKLQSFDLDLPEHLGNCVFCVKKGINKIALALRDEPELAEQFKAVILSDSVRVVERRQQENKIMYRGNNSIESIEAMYAEHTRDEIAATIRGTGGYDSGSCSESCEAFICDTAPAQEQK